MGFQACKVSSPKYIMQVLLGHVRPRLSLTQHSQKKARSGLPFVCIMHTKVHTMRRKSMTCGTNPKMSLARSGALPSHAK